MKDYRKEIAEIIAALDGISEAGLATDDVYALVEVPPDETKGDYAFPCFRLAKALKKAPQAIAQELAEKLAATIGSVATGSGMDHSESGGFKSSVIDRSESSGFEGSTSDRVATAGIEGSVIDRVESVGAYINFFISRISLARDVISEVYADPDGFGKSDIGAGKKIIVEFSSPNIAKPFHIGHIRSTVIGSSIERIYKHLGYDTYRINHLGDYGTQFGKMIVAYRRWGRREDVEREPIVTLLSYYTKFHEESEKDALLEVEARETFLKLEQGSKEETELWQWFREESLKEFGRVYDMLNIEFDSYAGESFYSNKMDRVLNELSEKGLLKESEGARIVDLDEYGLGKAMITKSDGSTLYITRDIAAAIYRKDTYDFDKNLYIVASQQNLHFRQWKQVLKLMGYDWSDDCIHIPFGLVSLQDGMMSTRAGRVVFLEDVLNRAVEKTRDIVIEKNVNTDDVDETARQVGIGAVIFNELHAGRIKDYVFNWDKVLNFDGETGPYVQYVHARAASVLRKAEDAGYEVPRAGSADDTFSMDDLLYISGDSAFALVKTIYRFPSVVLDAGEKYEPSMVTRHIIGVAQAFNRFYHDEQVLVDDSRERSAKLALVFATKQTIATGLMLLGIEAPDKM